MINIISQSLEFLVNCGKLNMVFLQEAIISHALSSKRHFVEIAKARKNCLEYLFMFYLFNIEYE